MVKIKIFGNKQQSTRTQKSSASGASSRTAGGRSEARSGGVKLQEKPVAAEPVKKPKPARKTRNKSGRLIIITVSVLAALVLLTFGLGTLATNSDKIFPNVSVDGVSLGGLTMSGAARTLNDAGLVSYSGKSVVVEFPMDFVLEIDANDAKVGGTTADLARLAYNYGRQGGSFSNLFSWLGAKFGGAVLYSKEVFKIDKTYVQSQVAAIAREIEDSLSDTNNMVGETEIILIKGSQQITVDEKEVCALIETAFLERNFEPIKYRLPQDGGDTVDLQRLYDMIFQEPVDAEYDKVTGKISESVIGKSFDIKEAQALWDSARIGDVVKVPLVITEPKVSSKDFEDMLFRDVLGSYATSMAGSSSARINNITLACRAINDLILNPGDVFSFNEAVGERTAAKGFQYAGAYNNGKVVSELGGGICQVSSTLYYVCLLANLEITDSPCHYFAISYLPSGLDATVSWPNPHYKFKNSRDYPIKLTAYTDLNANTITVRITGTDVDGSYVMMTTETWATSDGTGAVSYRNVYDKDKKLISRKEEARSRYYFQTDDDEPSPPPSASPSASPDASPGTSPSASPDVTPPVDSPAVTGPDPSPPPSEEPSPPPSVPPDEPPDIPPVVTVPVGGDEQIL